MTFNVSQPGMRNNIPSGLLLQVSKFLNYIQFTKIDIVSETNPLRRIRDIL